jgi:molybdopterin-guanine dinucleotide biosynthesis protein
MLCFPKMIMLGAEGRNAGKTSLACALISRLKTKYPVYALKVTAVESAAGECPRGGAGCGSCKLSGERFVLCEEFDKKSGKDTARLLDAGAEKVFWLRSLRSSLEEGFAEFLAKLPPEAFIICESNALREVVHPALFVMLKGESGSVKPSASRVAHLADIRFDNPTEAQAAESCLARLPACFSAPDR